MERVAGTTLGSAPTSAERSSVNDRISTGSMVRKNTAAIQASRVWLAHPGGVSVRLVKLPHGVLGAAFSAVPSGFSVGSTSPATTVAAGA